MSLDQTARDENARHETSWSDKAGQFVLQQPGVAMTALGAVATLTGLVATARYCAGFDVAPRSVGYETLDYILVAALILTIAAAIAASSLAQAYLIAIALRSGPTRSKRILAILGSAAVAVVVILAAFRRDDPWLRGVVTTIYVVMTASHVRGLVEADNTAKPLSISKYVAVWTVTLVLVAASFLWSGAVRNSVAQMKSTGHGTPTIIVLGPRITRKMVYGSKDQRLEGKCVLYLGASGNRGIFWVPNRDSKEVGNGTTLSVPLDDLTLSGGCEYQG